MKNAFYAVIFICFLFSSNAFAVNCGMLELELYDVEVREGATKTFSFALNNHASERFYIDKVNAYDLEQGIKVEEVSWQNVALAFEWATIQVSVKAERGAEDRDREGKVELRGHFLGRRECSYSDVRGEFGVGVLKEAVLKAEEKCGNFSLITLDEKFIDEYGEIEFIAVNNTNQSAVIKLESGELWLGQDIFIVPAGEEKKFSVDVQATSVLAELVYRVELGDCWIPSERTWVYSSYVPEPTPTPAPGGLNPVEVSHSIARDENGFLASVTIYNPNSEAVDGILGVIVPENWTVIGEGIVSIEPFTMVKAVVRLVPPEGFTGTTAGQISFEYDGEKELQDIELEFHGPGANVIGTAFAVLGSGAVLIGLVVAVAILLMVLFAGPHRQEFQPWQEPKKK